MATTQSFNLQGQLNTDPGMVVSQVGNVLTVTNGTPTVVVKVSGAASVVAGAQSQYTATVTGTPNTAVTWNASAGSISATGLFTAPVPAPPSPVTISAASVAVPTAIGSLPVTITQASGRTKLFPSGGNDATQLLAALAKGPVELSINPTASGSGASVFQFGPNTTLPAGFDVLQDDGTSCSDMLGYSFFVPMFLANGNGGKWTGSGGPNAGLITMPICFAKNMANPNEGQNQYNHGFEVNGGSNITVSGMRFFQCGGDGYYIENATNVSFVNCTSTNQCRNPFSITDNVNGIFITGGTYGGCSGGFSGIGACDLEPNSPGTCVVTISGLTLIANTGRGINNGLRLSIENLNSSNKVMVEVTNCTANGSNPNYQAEYPSGGKPSGWNVEGSGNMDNGKPTQFPN